MFSLKNLQRVTGVPSCFTFVSRICSGSQECLRVSHLCASKMEETKTTSKQRSSKEQLKCYISFVQNHPEIKLHKNDPTCPKRIDDLRADFAAQLNALKAANRSASKWKENLAHWKNQIRSRARKSKAHMMATGGGPCAQINISPVEQRALDTFGTLVVDGADGVPTIGVEELNSFALNRTK